MSPYSLIMLACLVFALPVVRPSIETHGITRTLAIQASMGMGIGCGNTFFTEADPRLLRASGGVAPSL